jgi:pimeloyl-[acyl-carrier protein] synthase
MSWKFLKRLKITKADAAVETESALSFDPDHPGFIQNPYPLFARLRKHEPLHMTKHGAWALSRYDDVGTALLDKRLSNEPAFYAVLNKKNREKYVCADLANNTLPFIEGDEHRRLRQLIAPLFLSTVRSDAINIEVLAEEVIDGLAGKKSFDFLHDFATPLSIAVLCRILGFSNTEQLKQWSDYFFYLFSIMPSVEVREQTDLALQEFRTYVAAIVEQKKEKRGDDLISGLLNKREEGAEFTDQELIDNCMLLFADGIGNVDSGLASLMALLLQHPQQLAMLYQDASLIPQAVDEALRFESPGQFIARVVTEDIEWHGVQVKKDQIMFLLLGSANRDAEVFSNPDNFDIRRENSKEALSFGKGSHSCVGAQLVRLELQAALKVFLQRYPNIQLQESRLTWRHRMAHRWLQNLPVQVSD